MNYNYNRLSQQQYQPPILPHQQNYNQPNYNQPPRNPQFNNQNDYQQQQYLPTFFNRLFGLPSHDEISLLKFKLKMIKTVLISLGFVVICIYFMVSNSLNRSTTISLVYEDEIALPLIALNFDCDEYLLSDFTMYINNPSNNSYDVIAARGVSSLTNVWNITGFYGNCISYTKGMFILLDDCIYLKDKEQLSFNIAIWGYENFNVGVLFNSQFYLSNSTQQLISGFTKAMKSDQYGNETTSYQASWAISPSQKGYMEEVDGKNHGYMMLSYGFYFYSNIVLMETTQTNFQLVLSSLSSIGSAFSIELIVIAVVFQQITKLLIRDKSAWIDDDVRECIIHHSNQINLKNIKSVLNNTDDIDDDTDDTCSVNSTSRNSSSYIGYDFNKARNKRKSTLITMARTDYTGINDYVDNEEEENEFNQDINKITNQQDQDKDDEENTVTNNQDSDKDEESENNNYFLLDDNK